jgi:hypothetical protein
MLTFHIKFEFRSRLLESLVGVLFDEQVAWWPRSNAAPCGFTASADRGRSGLEVTPNPTQGEMLVDALF